MKDKRDMVRDEWETAKDATYTFLPVTFDANGKPTIEWRDECDWRILSKSDEARWKSDEVYW